MRVKLTTTITTYIETSASVEEASKEIFGRYNQLLEDELYVHDIQAAQSNSVLYDEIDGTEVSHTFGEADE